MDSSNAIPPRRVAPAGQNRPRVLILEDDFVLARGLSHDLRHLGCDVIGPFAAVEDAVTALDAAGSAVVDVRLGDDRSYALADCLQARQLPFLFYTAYGRSELPPRFHGISLFPKPTESRVLLDDLLRQQVRRAWVEPVDAVIALPVLRSEARRRLSDPAAADRAVEATLRRALMHPLRVVSQTELQQWLLDLLDLELRRQRGRFLN